MRLQEADKLCQDEHGHGLGVERKQPRPTIKNAGHYVNLCRKLDYHMSAYQGAIIGVGYQCVPPRRWVDGEFEKWLKYWQLSVPRWEHAGSPHNRVSPEEAYSAMRRGIPPWITRHCAHQTVHGKTTQAKLRRAGRIARTRAAIPMGLWWYITDRAASKLGYLGRGLITYVVHGFFQQNGLTRSGRYQSLGCRHIDWAAVGKLHAQMLQDPAVELAWLCTRIVLENDIRLEAREVLNKPIIRWLERHTDIPKWQHVPAAMLPFREITRRLTDLDVDFDDAVRIRRQMGPHRELDAWGLS